MDTMLKIPTVQEYNRLVDVTSGDDAKMHWRHIFSWANDTEDEFKLGAVLRAVYGCDSPNLRFNGYIAARYEGVGFRPACGLTTETKLPEDERVVMGTLYMAGKPVKVPQNPTADGDVTAYIPGSKLEMRDPLDDPDYQVMGYRVGNAVVADRCLLTMISYKDIEKHSSGRRKTECLLR